MSQKISGHLSNRLVEENLKQRALIPSSKTHETAKQFGELKMELRWV
jgi:hypothetical protein